MYSDGIFIPHEIFCIILDFADAVALEKLCVATRRCRALYTAVLQRKWQRLTLNQEYRQHPSQLTKKSQLLVANAIRAPGFEQILDPTQYIRHLLLASFPSPNIPISIGNLPEPKERNNVPALLGKCISLRELDWDGSLDQAMLDEILVNIAGPIEILRVQTSSLRYGRSHFDWRRLSLTKKLKKLEIGQISLYDMASLINVLKHLDHVDTLALMTAETDPFESERSAFCGLEYLYAIDPESSRLKNKFPPRLKSLTISDSSEARFRPFSRLSDRPASVERAQLSTLEDLFFECRDPLAMKTIVDWWDMPNLKRLSLPCGTPDVLQPKFPHSIEYSTALIRDNVLQPMIDRYSKTLRQVILLDIWQNHSCDSSLIPVNVDWNQSFSITDLVCGTRPRRRPGQVLPSSQSEYITPWYQRTLDDCFLYKHLLEVHEVHPFLIRLRIDQVHFLDDLARDPEQVLSCGGHIRCFDELPERHLVRRITSHDLPELRVLAIREHRFWVAKEVDSRANNDAAPQALDADSKIWFLGQARSDPNQAVEIARSLDIRDWMFIKDLPLHPTEEDPYATTRESAHTPSNVEPEMNTLFKNYEGLRMMSHRNYMILHPAGISTAGFEQSKNSSSPYGRPRHWLHSTPYWDLPATRSLSFGNEPDDPHQWPGHL